MLTSPVLLGVTQEGLQKFLVYLVVCLAGIFLAMIGLSYRRADIFCDEKNQPRKGLFYIVIGSAMFVFSASYFDDVKEALKYILSFCE